jgi:putative photosynthetic complex assembly protein
MSSPIHFEPEPGARADAPPMRVPTGALYMAGALVAVVFALAVAARVFGFGAFRERPSAVIAERTLRFADERDGGIRVTDGTTGAVAAALPPGTNGFVRGALRTLTRARALAGIGDTQPFRLARYADGRLVLHDPATGQHVTITSFGPTQVESFDRLLAAP